MKRVLALIVRRRTDGHGGVCQHDAPATTGLERWGDWRGRWGGTGGDHGRQSCLGASGALGGDGGADQIAPTTWRRACKICRPPV